ALVGLAKRLEEVWLPGEDFPLVLPRTSPGLFLLQRLRDEAHRFAIAAHRGRRSKAMTRSVLDDVPGLGPTRAKALLAEFGSVAGLRKATAEEIAGVKGVGPRTAQAVVDALRTAPTAPTGPSAEEVTAPTGATPDAAAAEAGADTTGATADTAVRPDVAVAGVDGVAAEDADGDESGLAS